VYSALEADFSALMRYINSRFTYLLTYLYLSDSIQLTATATIRPGLQSAGSELYRMPRLKTVFGERAFSHAGPAVWNSLPASIQASTNITTTSFCRLLKTHLFNLALRSKSFVHALYDIVKSTVLFYFVSGH